MVMSDLDRVLEAVEEALFQAQVAEDADKSAMFIRAEELATAFVERFPESAIAHHTLALSWYHRPIDSPGRHEAIVRHLERAHSLDPSDPFVLAFLAYHRFDRGEFSAASRWLRRIPPQRFAASGQEWRDLKHRELLLACDILLGNPVDRTELAGVASLYREADEDAATWPNELVGAVLDRARTGQIDQGIGEIVLDMFENEDIVQALGAEQKELQRFVRRSARQ